MHVQNFGSIRHQLFRYSRILPRRWENRCATGSRRRVVHLKPVDFLKKRAPKTVGKQQANKNHQQTGNQQPQHQKEVPPGDVVDGEEGQQGR